MLLGNDMHALVTRLFPICRSITGNGVRETLRILGEIVPIKIHEVPSLTQVFDWTVPLEWNIREGYIITPEGKRIADFRSSNLHVVGYSEPVHASMPLEELQEHLYSLPDQPDAIPYVTSYYQRRWGFCITEDERKQLQRGVYTAHIDSELKEGSLTYGEILIPGESREEILLSTYVCHPSLANNELSGPVVTAFLVKWLLEQKRRYSYRIVFIPETIGSITYISLHLHELKERVRAGFNISCVGDDRGYSYLPTRKGDTLADRAALSVLSATHPGFRKYSFLDRGSDERQYNAVGVDLPVCSVMRTKHGEYPEYHTSKDDLSVVSPEGLYGGYEVLRDCIRAIEHNAVYRTTCLCEPQLGKRGLYPTISMKGSASSVTAMVDFLAYADGQTDLIDIGSAIRVSPVELLPIIEILSKEGLIEKV